jgi:Domain of unknown function (DUF1918)
MTGRVGDRIVVESERVGQPTREGEILEVLEGLSGVGYRVRWSDGHESLFRPSVGSARIVPSKGKRAATPKGKRAPAPKGKRAPAPKAKRAPAPKGKRSV